MSNKLLLSSVFITVFIIGCSSEVSEKTNIISIPVDRTPTNPNATPTTHRVLSLLADLTDGARPGVLSGQNTGHGNEIIENYDRYITTLDTLSGEKPAIVGLDYEFQRQYTLEELLDANRLLVEHWQTGGLVMITWSPLNPWGRSKIFDDMFTQYAEADLSALIQPGTEQNQKWLARLDIIAAALKDLGDRDVSVLWRPMQEMNGDWFWWGKAIRRNKKGKPNHPSPNNPSLRKPHPLYVDIYRHMFEYFTHEKKLNNLLWVFAPNFDQAFATYPYPGDDVVDVVAVTEYSDTLRMVGYRDALAYGKPVGFSEWGQSVYESKIDHGNLDNRLYVEKLKNRFPRAAFWVTWHSWYEAPVAIVDNKHARELMQDPHLINHGELGLGAF